MKVLALATSLLLFIAGVLMAIAFFAARAALAPLPGEWAVPLQFGPFGMRAGVPSLIRLATSPWGGPLLDGHSVPTRAGRVHLQWQASTRTLEVRCAPCTLQPPGLGQEGVLLKEVRATVQRHGEVLRGEITAGRVRGTWQGELAQGHLKLKMDIPRTPLADGYALFAHHIPELAQARIGGEFSLQATLSLPSGTLTLAPSLEGFQVAGLGTEALAGARSSCGRGQRASRLLPESWLARAVVAAEDQRFWDHPGYDLAELASSLTRNQRTGRVERGGSTLSQQVAKLLVTGDERSPVRKLRELLYAVEMERTLGKARILRLYLDNAPWGDRLCGAEAAAARYFGARAHELTPGEAAWLAAMLHNPALEAQRWAESGQINLARAQWVALALRGLTRKQKVALAEAMAARDWSATWAEPLTPPLPGSASRREKQGAL